MKKLLASSFIAYLATTLVCPLFGSIVEFLNTKQLVAKSSRIVTGEVSSKWSSYNPEKRMVYTYVKLRIDRTIKGQESQEVLLRIPGGTSNRLAMKVHGVAAFKTGEKSLVFIEQDSDGAPTPVAMGLGKYLIRKDSKTGRMNAYLRPQGMEFKSHTSSVSAQKLHHADLDDGRRTLPLDDLVKEIESAMKAQP